jgi:hypothetical protein
MRSLEMRGSFALRDEVIDETLIRTSPGNYALGYMEGDAFVVFYVGRSDFDLRQRLRDWVGVPSRYESYVSSAKAPWGLQHRGPLPVGAPAPARVDSVASSYTHFAYSYARSADDAYAQEWRNYDAFGGAHGLDNESAPVSTVHATAGPFARAAAAAAA